MGASVSSKKTRILKNEKKFQPKKANFNIKQEFKVTLEVMKSDTQYQSQLFICFRSEK